MQSICWWSTIWKRCLLKISEPGAANSEGQVRAAFRGFILDIALNAIIPLILYRLSKRYISPSEFTALLVATTFPIAKSIFDVAKRKELDPVAVVVLLGIVAGIIALLAGGSPRILLVRESFFTALFGIACFASLLLPRPMMFYFGRHFLAGNDPQKRRGYDISWQLPEVRFNNRLITIVWGSVYLAEFAIRVALIRLVPVAWVLVISPVLFGSLTLGTIVWTFRRARRAREAAIPKGQGVNERAITGSGFSGAPAFGVGFTHNLGIRHRADRRADFRLLVALDRGFARTAACFAPDQT